MNHVCFIPDVNDVVQIKVIAQAICADIGEGHHWTQFEDEARAVIRALELYVKEKESQCPF